MITQPALHLVDRTDGRTVWAVGDRTIHHDQRTPGRFYVWGSVGRVYIGEAATLEQAAEVANHG